MQKYIVTLAIFLFAIYSALFFLGTQGWGYSGYSSNYHSRPSFWYFSSPSYYPNKSVRTGSIGSSGSGGGGFHAGK